MRDASNRYRPRYRLLSTSEIGRYKQSRNVSRRITEMYYASNARDIRGFKRADRPSGVRFLSRARPRTVLLSFKLEQLMAEARIVESGMEPRSRRAAYGINLFTARH